MDERTTNVPSLQYILVHVIASLVMIFGINTTSSRAVRRVKFETTLKFHEWYLCQISRTNHAIICLLYTTIRKKFVIFTCRYFTAPSQPNCRNFSCSSINMWIVLKFGRQHKKGATGSRSQSYCSRPTHDLTDVRRLTTAPGSTSPTLFEELCGFFYVPQDPDKCMWCETGPTVFRPYPRRRESLTVCRSSSTFF